MALVLAGCATGGVIGPGDDEIDAAPGGTPDAAAPDARPDAPIEGPPDAQPIPDAQAPIDAPVTFDARIVDAGPADARPDARPDAGSADASTLDAMIFDAACRLELLENGGFESSSGSGNGKEITPWFNVIIAGSREMLVDTAAELALLSASTQAGGYAGRLGGENDAAHGLFISFTVPSSARSLVLSGWFWVRTQESTSQPMDSLKISILDENGNLLTQLGSLTAAQKGTAYTNRVFTSASPYAGRTLTLSLWAATDGTFPSDYFVDSLSLEAVVCP